MLLRLLNLLHKTWCVARPETKHADEWLPWTAAGSSSRPGEEMRVTEVEAWVSVFFEVVLCRGWTWTLMHHRLVGRMYCELTMAEAKPWPSSTLLGQSFAFGRGHTRPALLDLTSSIRRQI